MPHLTDTRLLTLDDARATLEALAHCEVRIAQVNARAEKKINEIKSAAETALAPERDLKSQLEQKLTAFILNNRGLFEKKRSQETSFGTFGLRKAANTLTVEDAETVIQWALDQGYDDLVETTRVLVKDAVKRRLAAGEQVPGCSIPVGDFAFYKVAKALLDEARESA